MASNNGIERRVCAGRVETRAADEDRKLEGHAAVFNQETVIGTWFREVIMPGCFTESIEADDIRCYFNHDRNLILGRNKAGTLDVSEDDDGLAYVCKPPKTTYADDLMVVVERGDVTQSSFGFTIESPDDEEWDYSEMKQGKLPLRRIKKARLWDVSPVSEPAYEGTDVQVSARAREMAAKSPDDPIPPAVDAGRAAADLECRKRRIAVEAARG